jgi:hypothetical protein
LNVYVRARYYLELIGSGVPSKQRITAETYAKLMLEYQFAFQSNGDFFPSDGDTMGEQMYAMLVQALGQVDVKNAASKLLNQLKAPRGQL